jgi:hypothetical protein
VRVSARMVGILLNSRSQRQNCNDLHLSVRFALSERRRREFESAALGYSELLIEAIVLRRMQIPDSAGRYQRIKRQPVKVKYLRSGFPKRNSLWNPENPGDTLSG